MDVEVAVGVDVGAGVVVGVAFFAATPLFQVNFLPDLVQVYFFPEAIEVDPALLHGFPAFTAPNAVAVNILLNKMQESRRVIDFFMT